MPEIGPESPDIGDNPAPTALRPAGATHCREPEAKGITGFGKSALNFAAILRNPIEEPKVECCGCGVSSAREGVI